MPIEPDNANGGLGINAYCPNTNYFANGTVLSALQVEELSTACLYVDYNCNIAVVSNPHSCMPSSTIIIAACLHAREALRYAHAQLVANGIGIH